MPAAENKFQILNLHPKNHKKNKNKIPFFLMDIYPNNTGDSTIIEVKSQNFSIMLKLNNYSLIVYIIGIYFQYISSRISHGTTLHHQSSY